MVLIMAYVWGITYATRLHTQMMSRYLLPLYHVCRNLLIHVLITLKIGVLISASVKVNV